MIRLRFIGLFLLASILFGCSKPEPHPNIRVAVAANFYPLMLELKKEFEAQNSIEVELVSGASGILSTQIRQGAPYDVFFSADVNFSEGLFADGYAASSPKTYAKGSLVLCSKMGNVSLEELCMVGRSQKIGIANPKTAPYGMAALAFLKKQPCFEALEKNLVFANNINQLDQYISNGVVGLGFTSASSVTMKSFLRFSQELPQTDGLEQACVLLDGKQTPHPLSQKLIDYILSEDIQNVIVSKGYRL